MLPQTRQLYGQLLEYIEFHTIRYRTLPNYKSGYHYLIDLMDPLYTQYCNCEHKLLKTQNLRLKCHINAFYLQYM